MRYGQAFPVRVGFAKRGRIRWISHRDLARAFERAFRIEALPLAFSQGFAPRPRVSFGLALPTGAESDDEYLDVSFAEPLAVDALVPALSAALPEGLTVHDAVALRDGAPALQEAVTSVEWSIDVAADGDDRVLPSDLAAAAEALLGTDSVVLARSRKGRATDDDVRPVIRELHADGTVVRIEVATKPTSLKPTEVLAALAQVAPALGDLTARRVLRTCQWIEREGARLRPLDADTRPRAPEARAS